RYELKLDSINSAKLREWADAVLFVSWDVRITENAEGRVRGVGGKERIIYATHSAAYDAKNRVGLPEKLLCNFQAISPLFKDQNAPQSQGATHAAVPAPSLREQLAAALTDIDPEILRLFLLNRKICDGSVANVPDQYAQKVLSHLPKFRQTLEQFAKEPF